MIEGEAVGRHGGVPLQEVFIGLRNLCTIKGLSMWFHPDALNLVNGSAGLFLDGFDGANGSLKPTVERSGIGLISGVNMRTQVAELQLDPNVHATLSQGMIVPEGTSNTLR